MSTTRKNMTFDLGGQRSRSQAKDWFFYEKLTICACEKLYLVEFLWDNHNISHNAQGQDEGQGQGQHFATKLSIVAYWLVVYIVEPSSTMVYGSVRMVHTRGRFTFKWGGGRSAWSVLSISVPKMEIFRKLTIFCLWPWPLTPEVKGHIFSL